MTTLIKFLDEMIAKSNEVDDAEPSYDYETMAFEAGVEYACKQIKEFLAQNNNQQEQKVFLSEYIEILNTLSNDRQEDDMADRDIGWEESGYQSALFDVKKYLENDEESINRTLEEYKENH